MNEDLNLQKEKILELLYSGESANDLLAFEIIKQLEDKKAFYFPLVSLCMVTRDAIFQENIYEYLEPVLHQKHKEYVTLFQKKNKNKRIGRGIAALLGNLYGKSNLTFLYSGNKKIKDFFLPEEVSELLFFFARRTGEGTIRYFDFNDDKSNHPKRMEVLNLHLNKLKIGRDIIRIPCLYWKEIEYYLERIKSFFLAKKLKHITLHLSNIKSESLPLNILSQFSIKLKIIVNGDFPSYLFNLNKLESLQLVLNDSTNNFPNDWNKSNGIKKLSIHSNQSFAFTNLDFVDTVPELESIVLSGVFLNHPDLLLKNFKVKIKYGDIVFSSIEGYESIDQVYWRYGICLDLIKASNLSLNEKRELLIKILNQEEDIPDIKRLSTNDLRRLLKSNDEKLKVIIREEIYLRRNKPNG